MLNEKACSKCGLEKPAGEFYPSKKLMSGLSSWCRACQQAETRAWKAKNPEKKRSLNAAWAAKNPEKNREMKKQSAHRNREARLPKQREYQKARVNNLSDAYVAAKLKLPLSIVPPDLLDAKRVHIQIHRIIKDEK